MNKSEWVIVVLGFVIVILVGYIISTNHKLEAYEKISTLINQNDSVLDEELYKEAKSIEDCKVFALNSEKNFNRCFSLSNETFFGGVIMPQAYKDEIYNYCRLNNPTKFKVFAYCINQIK